MHFTLNKMKFIVCCLFWLLGILNWSAVCPEELAGLKYIPDLDANPLPISLTYVNGIYALSIVAKLNWFQARSACARIGYTLAAIPTERNQTLLFKTIRQSGFQSVITEPVWTSGSNQANNNQWSWYTTGESIHYRKFQDLAEISTNGCLGINATTGFWSVQDCFEERYFMCQKRCW